MPDCPWDKVFVLGGLRIRGEEIAGNVIVRGMGKWKRPVRARLIDHQRLNIENTVKFELSNSAIANNSNLCKTAENLCKVGTELVVTVH